MTTLRAMGAALLDVVRVAVAILIVLALIGAIQWLLNA
jgi:hypothetical protein